MTNNIKAAISVRIIAHEENMHCMEVGADLMVEATPPRRIWSEWLVKGTILARGYSICWSTETSDESGVRKKARPVGDYV